MSKFFFEQLARILLQQVEKGDADRGLFVPIINDIHIIRDQDLVSFELIPISAGGLDLSMVSAHSILY